MPKDASSSSNPRDSKADIDARRAVEQQLEEVEAALAVLQGQDPEQLRRLREARAQAEREFKVIVERMEAHKARKARRTARKRRQLALRIAVGVVAVGALAALGKAGLSGRARWTSVNDSLDRLAAPYLARGLKAAPTKRATGNRIEASVAPGSCLIALAATDTGAPARLKVERGLDSLQADGSIAWCSCAEEEVVVTATAASAEAQVGVKLLAAQGAVLGGSRALALLEPLPDALGPVAEECEPAHLDGWIRAGRFPAVKVDQSFFQAQPERAKLVEAGFRVVARVPEGKPLGAFKAPPGSCSLALGHDPASPLSLRVEGGGFPLKTTTGQPLAVCTKEAASFALFREGAGEVTVLSVPSARVGGLLGLRESAKRAGLGEALTWAPAESLGQDAADTLRASGAIDPVISWPQPKEGPAHAVQARVIGLSVLAGGSLVPDPKSDAITSCSPTIPPGGAGQSICVQSWPQTWRGVGATELGGMAEAPLPFWLSSMQGVDHPAGLARTVGLLELARRLRSEGFEPTVLEGVVELKSGIDVLGRVGEDAVVAIGITPRSPWVIPYSDGVAWSLGGDPRVIDLSPGDHVLLTNPAANGIAPRDRRTIVFRRTVKRGDITIPSVAN